MSFVLHTNFPELENGDYYVLYNAWYGGFNFSDDFKNHAIDNGFTQNFLSSVEYNNNGERTNKEFIDLINKYGFKNASGTHSRLQLAKIRKNYIYDITEYDGY